MTNRTWDGIGHLPPTQWARCCGSASDRSRLSPDRSLPATNDPTGRVGVGHYWACFTLQKIMGPMHVVRKNPVPLAALDMPKVAEIQQFWGPDESVLEWKTMNKLVPY